MTEQAEIRPITSDCPTTFYSDLVAMQGAIVDVPRNGTNPFHKSKYSTLEDVLKTIRPILSSHNFAVVQLVGGQGGEVSIETRLIHASGESIGETVASIPGKGGIQAMGSEITYLRRYALCALLGITGDTDDDGECNRARNARQSQPERQRRNGQRQTPHDTPEQQRPAQGASGADSAHHPSFDAAEKGRFFSALDRLGYKGCYSAIADYCEAQRTESGKSWGRPSSWTTSRRSSFLLKLEVAGSSLKQDINEYLKLQADGMPF